jgi:hypothetical protein
MARGHEMRVRTEENWRTREMVKAEDQKEERGNEGPVICCVDGCFGCSLWL